MKYPAFLPRVASNETYVITRVASVRGGALVVYDIIDSRHVTSRVAFVSDDNNKNEWDMITHCERVPKTQRVAIKRRRVRIVQ